MRMLFSVALLTGGLFSANAQSSYCAQLTWPERVHFTVEGYARSIPELTLELNKPYKLVSETAPCYCDLAKDKTTWKVWPYRSAPVTNKLILTGSTNHQSATVTFLAPGVYSAELSVDIQTKLTEFTTCPGWSASRRKDLYIRIPYKTPVAKFSTDGGTANKTITQGTTINLKDISDNFPQEWKWTVSPSSGYTVVAGGTSQKDVAIRFNATGNYSVSLWVKNEAGQHTLPKTSHITVLPQKPDAGLSANGSTASSIVVDRLALVNFKDLSTNLPTSWQWAFSPSTGVSYAGSGSSSQNPTVSFSNYGNYSVMLTATNAGGSDVVTKTNYLSVIPVQPTVQSTATYCMGATAAPLQATGTSLKWYRDATAASFTTSAPTPATNEPGPAYYYVSQTINGYESRRAVITVMVLKKPSPPVVTNKIYCLGETAEPLTASGKNLRWYTNSSGGTGEYTPPSVSTSTAGYRNYYVTQTDDQGCESNRANLQVEVLSSLPVPSVSSPLTYCLNAPAAQLTAALNKGTGLTWYNVASGGTALEFAPVPPTTTSGVRNYYVAQTKAGCAEGPRATIQVVTSTDAIPAAPVVNPLTTYFTGDPATALTATGTALRWFTQAVGGTALASAPVPTTHQPGTFTWFVSQTVNGCESPRASVTVVVKNYVAPTAPAFTAVQKMNAPSSTAFPKTGLTAEGRYVTGSFNTNGPLHLGVRESGSAVTLAAIRNASTMYLARYNQEGKVVWAQAFGATSAGSGSIAGYEVGTDELGYVYVVGSFTGVVSIGSYQMFSNTGKTDIFLIKFNENGGFIWAQVLYSGQATLSPNVLKAFHVTRYGRCFVGGKLVATMKFQNTTLTPVNATDGYLAAYNADGSFVKAIVTPESNTNEGIISDYDGANIMVGASSKSLLSRYSSNLTLRWRRGGVSGLVDSITTLGIQKGTKGIYIAGLSQGSVTLTENFQVERTGYGAANRTLFVARYDWNGNLLWLRQSRSNGSGVSGMGRLAIDQFDQCFITAAGGNNVMFDELRTTSAGSFILHYDHTGTASWLKTVPAGFRLHGVVNYDYGGDYGRLYVKGEAPATAGAYALDGAPASFKANELFVASLKPPRPTPIITSVVPRSGFTNTKLVISGRDLLTVNGMTLNGSYISEFTILNDSTLETKIPTGATTGKVILYGKGGVYTDTADVEIRSYTKEVYPRPDWLWSRYIQDANVVGSGYPVSGKNVVIDSARNVYLTGYFNQSINLDDSTAEGVNTRLYVAKFKPDGTLSWLRTAGDGCFSQGKSLALDALGNVVVAIQARAGNFNFYGQSTNVSTFSDILLLKLDRDGKALWLQKIETVSGNTTKQVLEMETDQAGNIFVSGYFGGTIKCGSLTLSSDGAGDNFIIRFNPEGNAIGGFTDYVYDNETQVPSQPTWKMTVLPDGDCIAVTNPKNFPTEPVMWYHLSSDRVVNKKELIPGGATNFELADITHDALGNVYLSAVLKENTGPPLSIDGKSIPVGSTGFGPYDYENFLAKFNRSGTMDWYRQLLAINQQPDYHLPLVKAAKDGIYQTGYYTNGTIVGNDTLQAGVSSPNLYISRHDSLGNYIWSGRVVNTTSGSLEIHGLAVAENGTVTLSGLLWGGYQFGDSVLSGNSRFLATMAPPIPKPEITAFTPAVGLPGDTVLISGRNFEGLNRLEFNGSRARFNVENWDRIAAVVPDSATSGNLVIRNNLGAGKSTSEFTLRATVPGELQICPGSDLVIVTPTNGNTYKWQILSDNGYVDITDTAVFSGIRSKNLAVRKAPSGYYGKELRCLVDGRPDNAYTIRFVSYWNGGRDNLWDNKENWGCSNELPNSFTDVFIEEGNVVIDRTVRVRSLTLGAKATISLKPGVEVEIAKD